MALLEHGLRYHSRRCGKRLGKVVMMIGKIVWSLTLFLMLAMSVSITVASASSREISAFEKVISIEDVSKITGLSVEEVSKLRQ